MSLFARVDDHTLEINKSDRFIVDDLSVPCAWPQGYIADRQGWSWSAALLTVRKPGAKRYAESRAIQIRGWRMGWSSRECPEPPRFGGSQMDVFENPSPVR